MEYILIILIGILTVGYMIRHHILFTSKEPEETEEERTCAHTGEW